MRPLQIAKTDSLNINFCMEAGKFKPGMQAILHLRTLILYFLIDTVRHMNAILIVPQGHRGKPQHFPQPVIIGYAHIHIVIVVGNGAFSLCHSRIGVSLRKQP